MAIINFTGFECGAVDEYNGSILGTGSVQGTTKRSGDYALRINPGAAGNGSITLAGLDGSGRIDQSGSVLGTATAGVRFYFRVATLPTTTASRIAEFQSSTLARALTIEIGTDGKLRLTLKNEATTTGYSSLALSTGTWYRIDLHFTISATGTYNLRIDGTSYLSSGSADLGTGTLDYIYFGRPTGAGDAIDFYYDDVTVTNTDAEVGVGKVVRMDVSGSGYSDFGSPTGAVTDCDDYASQVGNDGDTSYRSTASSGTQTQAFALESASSAGVTGAIRATKAVAICRDTGTTNAWQIGTRSSTTNALLTTADGGSTYNLGSGGLRNHLRLTAPHTSTTWTSSDLDGAEVVVSKTQSQARELRCTAVALCVECEGALSVTGGTVASTLQLYTPTVTRGAVTVVGGTRASTLTLYAPTAKYVVVTGTVASTSAVYAPTVKYVVVSGTVASTATLYAPTVAVVGGSQAVTGGTVAATSTLYAPTVRYVVVSGAVSSTATLYAPSLAYRVAGATVASGSTLTAPSLAYKVVSGTVASTATLYGPAIKQNVTGGTIASASALYAPSLAHRVVSGTIASGSALAAPSLAYRVVSGTIASTATLYAPTIQVGAQFVTGATIASTSSLSPPSLAYRIAAATVAATLALYAPTVAQATTGATVASTSAAYAPAVSYVVLSGTVGSSASLYPPLVLQVQSISVPTLAATSALYPPVVILASTLPDASRKYQIIDLSVQDAVALTSVQEAQSLTASPTRAATEMGQVLVTSLAGKFWTKALTATVYAVARKE